MPRIDFFRPHVQENESFYRSSSALTLIFLSRIMCIKRGMHLIPPSPALVDHHQHYHRHFLCLNSMLEFFYTEYRGRGSILQVIVKSIEHPLRSPIHSVSKEATIGSYGQFNQSRGATIGSSYLLPIQVDVTCYIFFFYLPSSVVNWTLSIVYRSVDRLCQAPNGLYQRLMTGGTISEL